MGGQERSESVSLNWAEAKSVIAVRGGAAEATHTYESISAAEFSVLVSR